MVIDQGQVIDLGFSSSQWATLNFEPHFLSQELNDFGLPVEVRNSELKVVGHSTAPGSLRVKAPGKYYVLARLPAGQEITEEVEVQPLEVKSVPLLFDEEGISQSGVEELSHFLGLPERTLLPAELQPISARRPPPVAAPSTAPPAPTSASGTPRTITPLESLEGAELSPPAPPSVDPIDELLAQYAALTSPGTRLETLGADVAPPATTRIAVPPPRDLKPINLYLRLFRGNALALKTRALPAEQWETGFQSGSKGRLKLHGADEVSTLQVIQPGRPTLNIVLPISAASGCEVVIRRCKISPSASGALHRDEISFDVHMKNVKADIFLRYRAQGMLTEAAQLLDESNPNQSAMAQATQLLHDKFEDPVAAAVGAYGLLKFRNRERRDWINNLYRKFAWLPDGAAIEGECLARESKHEASLRRFLDMAERGLPLFTDGLTFVMDRLEHFTKVDRPGAHDEDIRRGRLLLELVRNYCQFADLSKLILRYTGRMPHLPNADPASLTPELAERDPTVLSLTLEGGDEGVVTAKPRTRSVTRESSLRSRGVQEEESRAALGDQSERHQTTERDAAVANLKRVNDPHSIALRLLHIASQSEADRIEESVDENTVLERVTGLCPEIGIDFLELGTLAARTVVHMKVGATFGTGFMVSPHLLLTTHQILADPDSASEATIDFDYEFSARGERKQSHTFTLRPDRFFLTNSLLDFTLVCVADRSTDLIPLSEFGFNRLNGEQGKLLCGEHVSIIHHPFGGPKSLQLRSGLVREFTGDFLRYETKTSLGSTGAPIFNDQWEIVGLHRAATLDSPAPAGEPILVNEAIRISSILRACRESSLTDQMQELLDQVFNPPEIVRSSTTQSAPLTQPEPPPLVPEQTPELQKQPEVKEVETFVSSKTPDVKGEREMAPPAEFGSGTSGTFTLPLQITVTLGAPAQPTQPAVTTRESSLGESFLEKIEPDEDYDNRPGYNPSFLGFPVPMPKLSTDIKQHAVKVPGGGHELKYYHYSVIMNGRRRLAFVSAGNFDAKAQFIHEREAGDKWFMDPRISDDFQAGEEIYSSNPLDRGHLVRRADAAWGRTAEEARLANDDTFHFTNCSPQHEVFNQSSKATKRKLILWGNIENHIAKQATHVQSKKVSIFNGPVFRQNDRKHRGLPIPREYWKIVVFRNDQNKARALAFILSQTALIKTLPTEDFMVGPYDVYQVKVREIETKTKLDFGELRTFDPLEDSSTEAFFETATEALVVADLRSIIL